MQRADQAIAYARRANRTASDNPAIIDTLGVVLMDQGLAARAITLLKSAHEQAPGYPGVSFPYAAAPAAVGQRIDAMELGTKAIPLLFKQSFVAE